MNRRQPDWNASKNGIFDFGRGGAATLDAQVEANLGPFRTAVELIMSIPGFKNLGAHVIISEIGIDMSRFPSLHISSHGPAYVHATTRVPASVDPIACARAGPAPMSPGRRRPGPNRALQQCRDGGRRFCRWPRRRRPRIGFVLQKWSLSRCGRRDRLESLGRRSSASRSSSALGGPRMICLKLGGRAAGHEPDGESVGLITIDGQRGRINSCSIIPGQRPRCRHKPGEHERA